MNNVRRHTDANASCQTLFIIQVCYLNFSFAHLARHPCPSYIIDFILIYFDISLYFFFSQIQMTVMKNRQYTHAMLKLILRSESLLFYRIHFELLDSSLSKDCFD